MPWFIFGQLFESDNSGWFGWMACALSALTKKDLDKAIIEYQKRTRKFGAN